MPKPPIARAAELRGLINMTIDAVVGVSSLAEALHMRILRSTGKLGAPVHKPLAAITRLVYQSVRGVTRLSGQGLDTLLASNFSRLLPWLGTDSQWPGRAPVLAALNGVLGDYLAANHNPLAIPMHLPAPPAGQAVNGRILILAHGLCMNDQQWLRNGHDHGRMLAAQCGYTPVYLHYNSGQHISSNGQQFAAHIEALLQTWPVPVQELVILCHSMGGLLTRSACHYGKLARHAWPDALTKIVFLGTPHHGAPLERGGNWFHIITSLSSYSAPFSRLGKIRSAGITDLRYGNVLDQDWQGRNRFAHGSDPRQFLPLPEHIACYTIAATTGKRSGDLADSVLGDGLVPLDSALGQHPDPARCLQFAPERQAIVYETNHMDLLNSPKVAKLLLQFLGPALH
jgi:hypothetical protein